MADQKKAPQLFHSDLFSSPSGGGSSGLSLGFDEQFSSPFSLAPATKSDGTRQRLWCTLFRIIRSITALSSLVFTAGRSPASSQSSKVSPGGTPPYGGSPKPDRRSKSPSTLTGQTEPVATAAPTAASLGTVPLSELSTVPLDSPVNTSNVVRYSCNQAKCKCTILSVDTGAYRLAPRPLVFNFS